MLSLEYIWSALAITQALAVTFQMGSKLLWSIPPIRSPNPTPTDPIGILQNVTTSTKGAIHTTQPTFANAPPPQQQDIDINHCIDNDDNSSDNDLLLCAFRLAVRIGSLPSPHLQQHGDDFPLTLELNGSNDDDFNNDMQWSPLPNIPVRRCVRTVTSTAVVEPYRLSMMPVGIRRDATSNNNNNISSISSNNNTDITNHDSMGTEPNKIQTPTTISRPQEPNTNVSSSSFVFHEYYEAQCSLVRNRTETCGVTIRAYAPKIFHQVRLCYSNDNPTKGSSDTNVRRRQPLLPVSFEESILQRAFTFLKTNSKGSQRSKNVFFYTNGGLTPPLRRSNRRRSNRQQPSLQTVPNYLIKSIKKDEFDTLLGTMLPKYVEYMEQYGSISLLNRIYGLYEIVIHADHHASQTYHVVVFNAVFDPSTVHLRIYDIKGSTVGRCTRTTTLDEEMAATTATTTENDDDPSTYHSMHTNQPSTSVTYKDLDLIQDVRNNAVEHNDTTQGLLHLTPTAKQQMVQQLQRDVQFLRSCCVMDYSLLIGIEQLPSNIERQRASQVRHSFWGRRQRLNNWNRVWGVDTGRSPLSVLYGTNHGRLEKYYLGVIDFLQPYNAKKGMEYRWKSLIHEKNAYSCIPPDLYAQRFIDFIDQHVV